MEKLARNQNFSPDAKVNDALKNDKDWRDIYDENADMTAGHLCDHIAEIYGLSEFVAESDWNFNARTTNPTVRQKVASMPLLATTKRSRALAPFRLMLP